MSSVVSKINERHPDTEVETINSTTPLIGDRKKNNKPSLATPEVNEVDDDREVVTKSYPGVDDGFFDNDNMNKADVPHNRENNGSAKGPMEPGQTPRDLPPNQENPENTDKSEDDNDGNVRHRRPSVSFPKETDFETHHHHHHDSEHGSGILEEIPDINVYQHKKTLAQGMMDLALFSANANQLRYVLDSYDRHPYYYPSLIFIIISLVLQIAIGVLLIWNATYNVKDEKEVCRANKVNNYTVIGIFLVTIVNVFVSAFGVADPVAVAPAIPVPRNVT